MDHSLPVDPAGQRGRRGIAHTLITPGNQYVSRLPTLPEARFVKLVTPRLAPARFAQYLIDAAPQGSTMPLEATLEHFVYGLAGAGSVGGFELADEGFAYMPPSSGAELRLDPGAQVLLLSRRYEPWPGMTAPGPCGGHARAVPASATAVEGLWRRELLDPLDPAHDFNMSLMSFDPGVGLHQIEIHDEEHGLYMTRGGGSYALDGETYAVEAGDFIYMAPYCPQWFLAGPAGGEYLLYKDVYRSAF
jgi:(S)-ureidoglycine aminohydrolase